MKKKKRITFVDVIIYTLITLMAIIILLPLWHILIISTSTYEVYVTDKFHLIPKSFSLSEYKRAFGSISGILTALFNTIKVTTLGTLLSMFLSVLGGYALSKKYLPGRKFIWKVILVTMFFDAGLITLMVPLYILVKDLHLLDSILVLFLPVAINSFNMIILKNYFTTLPASLEEAARIDGYNDLQILFKIILPISKPIIAAISLFYGVFYWNDYFLATLFINTNSKFPLQVVLRQMIVQNMGMAQVGVQTVGSNPEQFKMAAIIIGIIPVLIIYPFVQKHFTQGALVGAVKG